MKALTDQRFNEVQAFLQAFTPNKAFAAGLQKQAEKYTPAQLEAAGVPKPETTTAQLVLEACKFGTEREVISLAALLRS